MKSIYKLSKILFNSFEYLTRASSRSVMGNGGEFCRLSGTIIFVLFYPFRLLNELCMSMSKFTVPFLFFMIYN